jgi:hypothetical protein
VGTAIWFCIDWRFSTLHEYCNKIGATYQQIEFLRFKSITSFFFALRAALTPVLSFQIYIAVS